MSNYLFDLIAKSFNLIDTVQPLVLSVFEPLPEANLGWEPSIFNAAEIALETTSEPEKFTFDIVQLLDKRSPATNLQISEEITNPLLTNLTSIPIQSPQQIPKSITNLAPKPDLELSSNRSFSESVPTQISTNNQQLAANTERKTSTNPLTFAPARLLEKQPNKINPVVSFAPFSKIPHQQLTTNAEQKTSLVPLNFDSFLFSQSQLTQINPVVAFTKSLNIPNQQLTTNTEQKTSHTPLNFDFVVFSQNQPTQINPIISAVEPSNLVNLQPFLTQNFLESETLSPTVNPIIPHSNSEIFKPLLPLTKTFLSNHLNSVQATELNTYFSDPISRQSQLLPKSLVQQLIDIERLGLSLQLPINSDLQVPFNEHTIKPVIFPFAPQEKTFSQLNLNTTILRTAIANENNAPVSKLISELLGEFTIQSLNNQSIDINQAVSLHPLQKVLYLRQSFPQIQAETSTILSIPSVLQQEKPATENLHKQPTEINPVFPHFQLPQAKSYEAFPSQLQSKAKAITPLLTPVLPVETRTPATTIQPQVQLVSDLPQKPTLQTKNLSTLEILSTQIIQKQKAIPTLREPLLFENDFVKRATVSPANAPTTQILSFTSTAKVATSTSASTPIQPQVQHEAIAPTSTQVLSSKPVIAVETSHPVSNVIQPQKQLVSELLQKPTLQTTNISTSEILSTQVIKQPTAIPTLREPLLFENDFLKRGTVSSANAPTTQVLPLTSALGVETSTVIQPQEKFESELLQKPTLQTEDVLTSEILLSQSIEQPKAIPTLREPLLFENNFVERGMVSFPNALINTQLLPLTPVLAAETSHPTSSVIQSQVKHEEISSVSSANTFIIETTLANSQIQSLTSTTATQNTNPQEKLTSNVPGIQQSFVHKKISSMHPIFTDVSAKLPSPKTNSSTPPFVNNLVSSVASQPTTGLTAINSDIVPTPALHPSTAGTDIQSQVNFSDSHLSDFYREKASAQEVGLQTDNRNYHKQTNIQKFSVAQHQEELRKGEGEMNVNSVLHPANMQHQNIDTNEDIFTSPVENLILLQNASPNFSMSADRGEEQVRSSYFRQIEESDIRPLSEPINNLTVKNLSVIAVSSKKVQKRSAAEYETSPTIQVTIGQIEIRSAAPAPPPPRPKPRPASSVMSLNEYLQRRARGR
ncbi:hypothetical protein BV378_05525 [Nostoc sp. RF31YmG]|nr:hypothetical protein BV378_05525 [Nostoc sp. RF31YmG]